MYVHTPPSCQWTPRLHGHAFCIRNVIPSSLHPAPMNVARSDESSEPLKSIVSASAQLGGSPNTPASRMPAHSLQIRDFRGRHRALQISIYAAHRTAWSPPTDNTIVTHFALSEEGYVLNLGACRRIHPQSSECDKKNVKVLQLIIWSAACEWICRVFTIARASAVERPASRFMYCPDTFRKCYLWLLNMRWLQLNVIHGWKNCLKQEHTLFGTLKLDHLIFAFWTTEQFYARCLRTTGQTLSSCNSEQKI